MKIATPVPGEHSLTSISSYSERDIRPPEELATHDEKGEFEVHIKARGQITRYLYDHHPLDVIGYG